MKKETTKNLVMSAMMSAVICVMSMITIPFQPIPFSLSLIAIFLAGAILSPKYSLLSVLVYVVIGAVGLPVFSNMRGGIGVLFGVTGGYIMAYPLMAWMIAMSVRIFGRRNVFSLSVGMFLSLICCYLIGTLWYCMVSEVGFVYAVTVCVVPFVMFDLFKIVLATAIAMILEKTSVLKKISQN